MYSISYSRRRSTKPKNARKLAKSLSQTTSHFPLVSKPKLDKTTSVDQRRTISHSLQSKNRLIKQLKTKIKRIDIENSSLRVKKNFWTTSIQKEKMPKDTKELKDMP